jgi:hypothetical protein
MTEEIKNLPYGTTKQNLVRMYLNSGIPAHETIYDINRLFEKHQRSILKKTIPNNILQEFVKLKGLPKGYKNNN